MDDPLANGAVVELLSIHLARLCMPPFTTRP
jgi:hypothetical protein